MEKADLEDKWRDLQQTKLSKENQRALGETVHTSSSQEFASLDRTNKQKESFHQKRMDELNAELESIRNLSIAKERENVRLQREVERLAVEVGEQEAELKQLMSQEEEDRAKARIEGMMKKNLLADQLKDQSELLASIQTQIQSFATRTYPVLTKTAPDIM